jgi:hypothetical protein
MVSDVIRIAIAFFVLMCVSFLLKGIVVVYYDTEKKATKYYPRRRTGLPLYAGINVMSDAVKRRSEKFTSI